MEYMNSMYYTLSTIAQVLSGFIALSGVFVLFKLQELDKLLLKQMEDLRPFLLIKPHSTIPQIDWSGLVRVENKLLFLIQCKVTTGLQDLVEKIRNDESTNSLNFKDGIYYMLAGIEKILLRKKCIKILTIISILIGVLTIIYSTIILSRTDQLCESNSQTFLLVGVIASSISIITMTCSIIYSLIDYKIVETSNSKKKNTILSRIAEFVSTFFHKKQ